MTNDEIFSVVHSVKLGDKLSINDWHAKYTVCGVTENFILARYGQHYTIISKTPSAYCQNGIRVGDLYCAPDWWAFGYEGGYNFTDPEWVRKYMISLESGETGLSMQKRALLWFISVVGHTDEVYANKKINPVKG